MWKSHDTVAMAEPSSMFSRQEIPNLEIGRTEAILQSHYEETASCSAQDNLTWKAAYTRQHHEKSAARHLARLGVESFLPLYAEERHWSNNRKPILEIPLFPNYLFVRVSAQSRVQVLRTPGVIDIVGRSSTTDQIANEEIEILRSGLHLRRPEPHLFLRGESVRIAGGPLSGLEGVVLRQKGPLRVVITVPLIRQSVSVEIAAHELGPLYPISSR
jgi:transcription antitermination factor NusG